MLTLFQGDFGTRDTFRFIEEKLRAGLWDWDLKTNAMRWSRGIFALLGLQPDAVTPHFNVLADLIHPDDWGRPSEVGLTIAGLPIDREFRILQPNGRIRWVHNKGEGLTGSDGKVVRAVGIMRDVTIRQEVLLKLQLRDERLNALTGAVGELVWTARMDGNLTKVENWKQLRPDPIEGVLGQAWIDFVHPDDRAATLNSWDDARSRRVRYEVEHRVRQADGSYRWHLSRGMPVKSADGRVDEYVGVSFDIHGTKVLPPMADVEHRLTGMQIRAARGILRWSVRDLADIAKVSAATIRRLEETDGATVDDAIAPISGALRAAGVEFFSTGVGKPGVFPR